MKTNFLSILVWLDEEIKPKVYLLRGESSNH